MRVFFFFFNLMKAKCQENKRGYPRQGCKLKSRKDCGLEVDIRPSQQAARETH